MFEWGLVETEEEEKGEKTERLKRWRVERESGLMVGSRLRTSSLSVALRVEPDEGEERSEELSRLCRVSSGEWADLRPGSSPCPRETERGFLCRTCTAPPRFC